ncbi:glycosyltransferase [Niveispirillum sp. KHB5.9]|uniref:glycosyltransferase n=1 Tax=Niveispirillum sp. KHB5.9 TaxID=3400269 RepID=UPI003A8B211B
MRIVMMALGSRGDIQPFAALAAGLAARGHAVRLLTYAGFADLVEGRGVTLVPVDGDIREDLGSEAAQKMFDEGASPLAVAGAIRDVSERYAPGWAKALLEAARTADLIIPAGATSFIGATVAEKLGIPYVQAYPQPNLPTRAFPSPLAPPPKTKPSGFANWLQSWAVALFFWQVFRPGVNRIRRDVFDLPPYPFPGPYWRMQRDGGPVLFGHSPSVLAKPDDWPAAAYVTGYWFLDHPEWEMPFELAEFLAGGPRPIYVGFGSMMPGDAAATSAKVVAAVRRAGCRAILAGGWGGLKPDAPAPDIFWLDGAPHDRLFCHVDVVVHHGGAGTTAAGLRSGVPAVVVPFLADQFFWAWWLEKMGVSGGTIRHRELDAERLAAAIRLAMEDPAIRQRAAFLGRRIRDENGIAEAVRVIEGAVGQVEARAEP